MAGGEAGHFGQPLFCVRSAFTQQRREEGSHCVILPGALTSADGIVLLMHHSPPSFESTAQKEKVQSNSSSLWLPHSTHSHSSSSSASSHGSSPECFFSHCKRTAASCETVRGGGAGAA